MKIILKRISFAALVFLGTVLLYQPSARYAFVDHDDPEYVIENPNMREGLTWENMKWAFMSVGYANNWHPLAWISMMMDVTLAGPLDDLTWNQRDNRVAHVMHLHNILLHASNAVLLFVLLGLFLGKDCDSKGDILRLLLTLFWAVHPLRCEVVCWCSERKELTSVFFMLSSLIAYLCPASGAMRRQVNYWGSVVLFTLAILAKPVAITLPTVMFAWDWIFKGKPRWLKVTPFILLSLACCFLTISSQKGALESGADQLICQRLESIFVAPLVYQTNLMALWAFLFLQIDLYDELGGSLFRCVIGPHDGVGLCPMAASPGAVGSHCHVWRSMAVCWAVANAWCGQSGIAGTCRPLHLLDRVRTVRSAGTLLETGKRISVVLQKHRRCIAAFGKSRIVRNSCAGVYDSFADGRVAQYVHASAGFLAQVMGWDGCRQPCQSLGGDR